MQDTVSASVDNDLVTLDERIKELVEKRRSLYEQLEKNKDSSKKCECFYEDTLRKKKAFDNALASTSSNIRRTLIVEQQNVKILNRCYEKAKEYLCGNDIQESSLFISNVLKAIIGKLDDTGGDNVRIEREIAQLTAEINRLQNERSNLCV